MISSGLAAAMIATGMAVTPQLHRIRTADVHPGAEALLVEAAKRQADDGDQCDRHTGVERTGRRDALSACGEDRGDADGQCHDLAATQSRAEHRSGQHRGHHRVQCDEQSCDDRRDADLQPDVQAAELHALREQAGDRDMGELPAAGESGVCDESRAAHDQSGQHEPEGEQQHR